MREIRLGHDRSGEDVVVDLEKSGIRFVLLVGQTGSGKSVFHNHLHREMTAKHTAGEIGLVFVDSTRLDFVGWREPGEKLLIFGDEQIVLPPFSERETRELERFVLRARVASR